VIWCNGGVFPRVPRILARLLPALVLACAGVVLAQGSAHAVCRCLQDDGNDIQSGLRAADAVFSGVLVDSSGVRGNKSDFATYEVRADTLFKGDVPTATVEVRSKNNDCALGDLKTDKRYVFFVTEQGSEFRADRCGGTTTRTAGLVAQVEGSTGEGTPLGRSNQPEEPVAVEFTKVADAEPNSLARIAAPGAALVLIGLLGLLVVRRVRD
jgi:hypothetical protein